MPHPDPESISVVAKALIAVAGVILALLGFTKVSNRAAAAKSALTDPYMTQAQVRNEILECQIKLTDSITDSVRKIGQELHSEFIAEVKDLHKRINEHEKTCNK